MIPEGIQSKLKAQVGDLKSVYWIKSQYASMLQDTQDLQSRLNDGQQRLTQLSDQYMKVTTQTPPPTGLEPGESKELPIPMAVETFVTSLGIDLTEEERPQLHGLFERPKAEDDEINKRRKTETVVPPHGGQCG